MNIGIGKMLRLNITSILARFLILVFVFLPLVSKAAIEIPNPLEADTIVEVIEAIGDLIFYVGLALVTLMILIGGIMFITAAGDPQKVATARRLFFWTAIGAAVVIFAKAVTGIIAYILGG